MPASIYVVEISTPRPWIQRLYYRLPKWIRQSISGRSYILRPKLRPSKRLVIRLPVLENFSVVCVDVEEDQGESPPAYNEHEAGEIVYVDDLDSWRQSFNEEPGQIGRNETITVRRAKRSGFLSRGHVCTCYLDADYTENCYPQSSDNVRHSCFDDKGCAVDENSRSFEYAEYSHSPFFQPQGHMPNSTWGKRAGREYVHDQLYTELDDAAFTEKAASIYELE